MNTFTSIRLGLALAFLVGPATSLWGDAKSELLAAAQKLADAKNYSWTSTLDLEGMPFKPGPTSGKRVKDGFMWISTEMMGNTSEVFVKGTNGVAKVDGEWQSESELPQFGGPRGPGGPGGERRPERGGGDQPGDGGPPPGGRPPGERGGPGGPGGPGAPGGRGGFAAMGARRLLTTKAPHDAAIQFAEQIKDLKLENGSIAGELPPEVLKDFIGFGGRGRGGRGGGPGGAADNAKGWIKVKLTDGTITKTIVEIESEMRTPDGGTQLMNAITTTEIKEVGTTQLDVPEAVKAKLARAAQ